MKERDWNEIVELIKKLRSEEGCPWDREQNLSDIISSIISEAYELQWAYHSQADEDILDELGDVLFLTCYAIAVFNEKAPDATIGKVAAHAYAKIKRRHPHVFGGMKAANKEESISFWNDVKAKEKAPEKDGGSLLRNLEANLPPLQRAEKIQRIAARVGFDWEDSFGIMEKLHEEMGEVRRCLEKGTKDTLKDELGDMLFTVVNLCRFNGVSCEDALSQANAKFIERFSKMESLIDKEGKKIGELNLDEMDNYWEEAKKNE